MPKPTLIFAPGAWSPSTAFDPIFPKLSDYKCRSIAFPSITKATEVKDLEPDTQVVRSAVQEEIDDGQDVIVISHSWAGLPVNSALDGLSKLEREAAGLKGGVVKLVFIAAFLPQIGEGLIGAFGGTPPPWYVLDVSFVSFARCIGWHYEGASTDFYYRKKQTLSRRVIRMPSFSMMSLMARIGRNCFGLMPVPLRLLLLPGRRI
jgi:hypothetical protein